MQPNNRSPWLWVPTLAFSDGLPLVVVMTLSVILYKQLGLNNAAITFYTSWLYLPWVLKPLWSPFVDLIKTKRWWVLAMEVLIGAALGGIAFTIPTAFWMQSTLFFFWLLAFGGACHCIAADGFYMLGLDSHQQAWFMGIRSMFDRLATIFAQGVLVMVAGNLQVLFRGSIAYSWSLMFYGVAGLFVALWLWHQCALPHPAADTLRQGINVRTIWHEIACTFSTFVRKGQLLPALLFIMLFRLPEGLLAKVSALFLIDAPHNGGLGLSPQEYGLVQGTVGVIGVALGGICGGIAASRGGLKRWLWPMAGAFTLPSVVYGFLSYALPQNLLAVNVCVFLEQFGYGFGLTAYMLFLIYFSQGSYKTSHYALASALVSLSMMLLGLFAGTLQESMGYRHYFLLVVVCCAATFAVTALVNVDPGFGRRETDDDGVTEGEKKTEE